MPCLPLAYVCIWASAWHTARPALTPPSHYSWPPARCLSATTYWFVRDEPATRPEIGAVAATEESLRKEGIDYIAGRWRAADSPRGCILGDDYGLLKLLFRRPDMRLLGAHVIGEHATETVHIGMIAMLADGDAELFNRACFNFPTLGDLYKYATYHALVQTRAGSS
jgi:Pyridine nucleotide-disulphide oxidoreductase, dimerisation domain